jgi:4-hydroxybenzoate polyprenyltransferase
VIVDVMLLSGLYTIRIIAGSAATGIQPSFWLLSFSLFIFLSLALVKRYSEMRKVAQNQLSKAAGRGYSTDDLVVLLALGAASGNSAVLVLALYINSPDISKLYANPTLLWFIIPCMTYWISRVWLKSHRGEMHDDPVVFAAKDWQSLVIVAVIGCIGVMAAIK